ncbi:MAG TPA: hypothetical protein VHR42_04325, partial [Clostridia bacterium]|nr:hypothetical protein [Clostridia bacterium]
DGGGNWGRYSFLGFDPLMTIQVSGGETTIVREGNERIFCFVNEIKMDFNSFVGIDCNYLAFLCNTSEHFLILLSIVIFCRILPI